MRDNPVQFAVVREDARTVASILERHPARRALLIASGGCTALSLASTFPELELTLVDPNPSQIELVVTKVSALERLSGAERAAAFNVENDEPTGLCARGNFESLFRGLRRFLEEFVLDAEGMRVLFTQPEALAAVRPALFEHRYWPLAFETFFSDALLETMFGPDATQHAPPGSYPAYFRDAFERGLTRDDAFDNPFLHHVLLGHYLARERALPRYLVAPPSAPRFVVREGRVDASLDLAPFDLVDLSNVMDWMAPADVDALLAQVRDQLRPGAVVVWRQLNNDRPLHRALDGAFAFDAAWERELLERDRSLFYSHLHVGVRNPERPWTS